MNKLSSPHRLNFYLSPVIGAVRFLYSLASLIKVSKKHLQMQLNHTKICSFFPPSNRKDNCAVRYHFELWLGSRPLTSSLSPRLCCSFLWAFMPFFRLSHALCESIREREDLVHILCVCKWSVCLFYGTFGDAFRYCSQGANFTFDVKRCKT